MKLLITLVSTFLLMIQMPIHAEDEFNDDASPTTEQINVMIENFTHAKVYIKEWEFWDFLKVFTAV